jgi:hypothetical protein
MLLYYDCDHLDNFLEPPDKNWKPFHMESMAFDGSRALNQNLLYTTLFMGPKLF